MLLIGKGDSVVESEESVLTRQRSGQRMASRRPAGRRSVERDCHELVGQLLRRARVAKLQAATPSGGAGVSQALHDPEEQRAEHTRRENELSAMSGRSAVDAATQHVEAADAAGDLAQLQRQQGGARGNVRRLARHRLRRSPVLVHPGTIGDHSDECHSAVACTDAVRLSLRLDAGPTSGDDASGRTALPGDQFSSLGHREEDDRALNCFKRMP